MVGIFQDHRRRRGATAARGRLPAEDHRLPLPRRDRPKTGGLEAGRGFTDSEVTGWLIVLLFAGQHTSSITATWLGAMLLQHPEAMAEVKREQEARCPDEESLNYANLLEMDAMRRSITETLRLYPPLILLMRKVMRRNFKVGQHTIPKGDVVGLCAPASNLDPRYWPDATAFRPSRYLPGEDAADRFDSRSVGHGLLQGFMLSFGGGAHMCSGRRFGYLQVSTIWTILLRDFDMEMVTPLPKPAYNDMVVGPDAPIMMRYKRKVPLAQAAASKAKGRVEAREAAAQLVAAAASAPTAAPRRRRPPPRAGGGGVSLSSARPASAAFPRGPLVILWGSQTGTAEGFGNQLMREARMRGFDARSVDLEEYAPEKLADEDEAPVVFLMSTHGEGEPTDNARAFYRYFEDERCDNLKSLRYAAFALGNTQYQHFCAMGKWVDATCAKLGATRLCELGLGNDDDDLEGDFEAWREVLWAALCPDLLANGAAAVASGGGAAASAASPKLAPTLAAPPAQFDAERLADDAKAPSSTHDFLSRCQPKHTLFECVVKANRELCAQPQYGSVRHVELAAAGDGAAAPLRYNTADDLAVCCDNGDALATKVAARLGLAPDARLPYRARVGGHGRGPAAADAVHSRPGAALLCGPARAGEQGAPPAARRVVCQACGGRAPPSPRAAGAQVGVPRLHPARRPRAGGAARRGALVRALVGGPPRACAEADAAILHHLVLARRRRVARRPLRQGSA